MADGSRAIDDRIRLFEAIEDAWFAEGANLDYTRFADNAEEKTKDAEKTDDDYVARKFQQISQTILQPVERNWFLTYNPRIVKYANE